MRYAAIASEERIDEYQTLDSVIVRKGMNGTHINTLIGYDLLRRRAITYTLKLLANILQTEIFLNTISNLNWLINPFHLPWIIHNETCTTQVDPSASE